MGFPKIVAESLRWVKRGRTITIGSRNPFFPELFSRQNMSLFWTDDLQVKIRGIGFHLIDQLMSMGLVGDEIVTWYL